MRPSVGSSKPAIIRRHVVLPDPDGPSIEKNSPSRTSRSTPSTATTSPKRLVTPSSRTAMPSGAAAVGASGTGAASANESPRLGRVMVAQSDGGSPGPQHAGAQRASQPGAPNRQGPNGLVTRCGAR